MEGKAAEVQPLKEFSTISAEKHFFLLILGGVGLVNGSLRFSQI